MPLSRPSRPLVPVHLQRYADADLLRRLTLGSSGIYPFMLLMVGITTTVRSDHPRVFWGATLSIASAIELRLAMAAMYDSLEKLSRRWFFFLLSLTVLSSAGVTGVLYLESFLGYGFTTWTYTVMLIFAVGIASGAILSFTPSFGLLALHVSVILGPVGLFSFLTRTREGTTIGFATLALLAFLLLEGHRLHILYWQLLVQREREATRVAELEEVKKAAEEAREAMRFQATHDSLTRLLNREEVLNLLGRELIRAYREEITIGILMLDIDHFKLVNDAYGHLAGDQVLRGMSERLQLSLRPYDAVGRYGGEEFLVVMPGCTLEQVKRCAERIRKQVHQLPIALDEADVALTVSIGITVSLPGEVEERNLLRRADGALYRAKHAGRNCVVLA